MNKRITIQDLFPDQSPEEQKEIEEAFDRYIVLVTEIYEEFRSDPERYAWLQTELAKTNKHTPPDGGVCGKSPTSPRKNSWLK